MPKCPKCGEEYDSLCAYSLEENEQKVTLVNGELDWSASDPIEDSCKRIDFRCPNCSAIIYSNKGDSTDPRIKELLQPTLMDEIRELEKKLP